MTRTGSIGVVWATPVLEDLYRKLGITSETYRSGEHTDMFSRARPLTEEERAMMDAALDFTYASFVSAVAEGRGLTEARVRDVGEGRVYFGETARSAGLVDEIGTLDDAVAAAASRAGIQDDYRVITFTPPARGLVDRALRAVATVGSFFQTLQGTDVQVEER
jgi:protease-4